MKKNSNLSLEEIGLPRANSNGLFIAAMIVIVVFSVMAFSCSSNNNQAKASMNSPAQPLSGNEWFVGKAQGIELPKPPVLEAHTPPDDVEAPRQVAKAPKQSPTKRLGGKVLNTNGKTTESSVKNHSNPPQNEVTTFNSEQQISSKQTPRPDYYLQRDVEEAISSYEIKAGTTIPAQLDIAINSDLGGSAVAHITRTIYDSVSGGYPLIPQGTKIYGNINSNVNFGQTRVDVIWERIIFPNGASLVVQNMRAADKAGQTGLHHTVDNHFDKLFGGAILLSAISSGVQLSQPQRSSGFNSYPTVGETMSGALGQNLGQVSTELIRQQMEVKPTIIIPNGERITIIANKDMVFPGAYGEWE